MINIDYSFIKIIDNKLILWDYLNRNQYEISPELVSTIYNYINSCGEYDEKAIEHLQELNILRESDNQHWGWDCLSHIYHHGTKNVFNEEVIENTDAWVEENDRVQLQESDSIMPKFREIVDENSTRKRIVLSCKPSNLDIEKHLNNRKTTRDFIDSPVPFPCVESILTICYKASFDWENSNGKEPLGKKKTSPSGGGLHPTQTYVVALNVDGLEKGIYFYNDLDHDLSYLRPFPNDYPLSRLVGGQPYAENAAFLIILTTRFDLSWIKYKHSRCYRVSLLDVGHLSQSTQLVTSELGLGSWITGQLCDSNIECLLGCDTAVEAPVYCIAIGNTTGNSFPND